MHYYPIPRNLDLVRSQAQPAEYRNFFNFTEMAQVLDTDDIGDYIENRSDLQK